MRTLLFATLVGTLFAGAGSTWHPFTTFYAAGDNDPANSRTIAYPKSSGNPTVHDAAGGIGTWANPVTFATDPRELAPGTRIYVPRLRKYFVMEDQCRSCTRAWNNGRKRQIDLWAGPYAGAAIVRCEYALTLSPGDEQVIVHASAGRPVDLRPIYSPTRGCWQ
jgi:hypothetical protein